MKKYSLKKRVLNIVLILSIVISSVFFSPVFISSAEESSEGTIIRNTTFTSTSEMKKKAKIKNISDWSPLYLTQVENTFWTFASEKEYGQEKLSLNLVKNAYRSLEMMLDNGYTYSYKQLDAYTKEYLQKKEGQKDGFYNILTDCMKNPYIKGHPEAEVTATTYNGRDYSQVFDASYYYNNNPDLQTEIGNDPAKLLKHFVEVGINQGRRGNEAFDVHAYKAAIDQNLQNEILSSELWKSQKKGATAPLAVYSYSLANYYGLFLGHYKYDDDKDASADLNSNKKAPTSNGTYKETSLVSVYTGLPTTSKLANQRPLAVMMPTDAAAQPSYGIGNADILYEIMEEGNISRQMAIINDWQNLKRIGNLRSTRLYYTYASREWDALLVHFGGVFYLKGTIDSPDMNNISGTYEWGTGGAAPGAGYFFRTSDRKAPHNAYISAEGIKKACRKLGYSQSLRSGLYNPKHFTFSKTTNNLSQYPNAQTANTIDLSNVFSYTKSRLTYDAATGTYKKYLHGKAQVDALTGTQLRFTNVLVQNTSWKKMDKKGYLGFNMLDSTRDGYYFTKGKCIHVTWFKSDAYEPTKYFDDNGMEIELNPGKTYIAVAQEGKKVIFK